MARLEAKVTADVLPKLSVAAQEGAVALVAGRTPRGTAKESFVAVRGETADALRSIVAASVDHPTLLTPGQVSTMRTFFRRTGATVEGDPKSGYRLELQEGVQVRLVDGEFLSDSLKKARKRPGNSHKRTAGEGIPEHDRQGKSATEDAATTQVDDRRGRSNGIKVVPEERLPAVDTDKTVSASTRQADRSGSAHEDTLSDLAGEPSAQPSPPVRSRRRIRLRNRNRRINGTEEGVEALTHPALVEIDAIVAGIAARTGDGDLVDHVRIVEEHYRRGGGFRTGWYFTA